MQLDKKQILEIQNNNDPYLFVDHVTKLLPGKKIEAYKDFKETEWYFKVHWPTDPNVPGMLQLEALSQVSSLIILSLENYKSKIMYLTDVKFARFFKKVLPGERMIIYSELKNFKRGVANFDCKGLIDDKIVCKAEIRLILPDEIKKFSK